MKIAIHNGKGFNKKWIEYCEKQGKDYKVVNCYKSTIIKDLEDCDALMWHFHHENPTDMLIARQLLFALQTSGKKVFPDFHTSWHFDDKIGQKYLFESIGAPLVPSYVFYSKEEALTFLKGCSLPIVFKLRSGSASHHVKLITSRKKGFRMIYKSFGRGYRKFDNWAYFMERIRKYREGYSNFSGVLKGFGRLFIIPTSLRSRPMERGYVYLQEFIPDNDHDIRVIVIGDKAFALKRLVRSHDFRASGSGNLRFEKELFSNELIQLAFDIGKRTKNQCAAMDFLHRDKKPLLVEISFGFPAKNFIEGCIGYWDRDLSWHEGEFNPYGWMVETVLNSN